MSKTKKHEKLHRKKIIYQRISASGKHITKILNLMAKSFNNISKKKLPSSKLTARVKDIYNLTKKFVKKEDFFVPRSSFYYFVEDFVEKNGHMSDNELFENCYKKFKKLSKFQLKLIEKENKNK
ncbi:hypothetical protein H311_03075 [Anncaliia algerae PRA109]|nr:hypothetical protein H311_03075 [Anncaliia algerae PRA109]